MKPAPGALQVLFSDEDLLVVNKPAGALVLPDRWDGPGGTVPEDLQPDWGLLWVVHRIDRPTSGLLVLARHAEAHQHLNTQFSEHTVEKVYYALVQGRPLWERQTCEAPLRPDGDKQHRTVVDLREGKPSVTAFHRLESFKTAAYLECEPRTGRTHQIRAHLKALGHPLLGDELYGGASLYLSSLKRGYRPAPGQTERPLLARAALHAGLLSLAHPRTGDRLTWEAPLPEDFEVALKQLRKFDSL